MVNNFAVSAEDGAVLFAMRRKDKKEELPGKTDSRCQGTPSLNLLRSPNQSVEIAYTAQDYRRSKPIRDLRFSLVLNRTLGGARRRSVAALTVAATVDEECAGRPRTVQHAHGEFNAVVRAGLAHQAAHVGLHGALLDTQMAGDLSIGTGLQDQVQDLALAVGQVGVAVDGAGIWNLEQAVDEFG